MQTRCEFYDNIFYLKKSEVIHLNKLYPYEYNNRIIEVINQRCTSIQKRCVKA